MKVLKFETLYRNAKKKSADDIGVFKNFVSSITKEEIVNVWSFEQNELKTKHNGKVSTKQLCLSFYLNYFNLTTW